jgi:hypothetical protein
MRALSILAALIPLCLAASPALGGSPSLECVAPGVGQRGTEFQLHLKGAGLAEAAELMLYSAGVECAGLEVTSDNEVTARIRAGNHCLPGTYPFRLRTKQGLSELRVFRITPFPVVAEAEPNSAVSEAQVVPPNVTIAGVIEAGDVDCFELTLRRGDRLSAEVEAIRLGGPMLDTLVAVFGPDGKKIVSVDDTPLFRQDPFVTIVAPADGRYVVQVRETSFDGDENSRYALHLGTFPRPAYVYPAGGQAGQTVRVRFGGDASGDFQQEVRLPDTPVGRHGLFATHQGLASPTPNPFRVSEFANVLEPDNNAQGDVRQGVELPVAFNGILSRAGDIDQFPFRAAQGGVWQFEAFAARLGSPIDSLISISDASGRVLVANDDDGTHDSRLVFTAPHDGEYVLSITDKRGEGGVNFVYRVEAAESRPCVAAFLPRPNRLSQDRQAIVVPQGNRVMALVGTQRPGFDGTVRLAARGLPTGVSFWEADVPLDMFCVPVVFEAGAEAPLAGALAEVLATGESTRATVAGCFIQVVDLIAGSADTLFASVEVDRLAVAVVEKYPFTVALEDPQTALAQDGTIALAIRVERTADFDGAVDVSFPFLPPWIDGPEKITVAADQTTAVFRLRSFPQAKPQTWRLCAEAIASSGSARPMGVEVGAGIPVRRRNAKGGGSSGPATPVSSKLVALQVSTSPVTGTIGTVVTEQGRDVKLVCELKTRAALPQQMTATLEGLPNRVAAEPVTVSGDERSVVFTVKVDPTAPVGSFPSLVCRLSGAIDGHEVSYCTGRGGILRIERAGALVTDDAGRALSPLEVLRKSRAKVGSGKKAAP